MALHVQVRSGIRTVAIFEAAKATVVLLAGFGILALIHGDAGAIAAELVGRLHLDPSNKYPSIFIDAVSRATDSRLWFLAALALAYAALRYAEAYGLWRQRTWAEWLALVSGGVYLPLEVLALFEKLTWIRVGSLIGNLAVVLFMGAVLTRATRARIAARAAMPKDAP